MTQIGSPIEVAAIVCAELVRQKVPCPPIDAVSALFQLMYFASMRSEEGQTISFHTIYVDPDNHDPKPPKVMVKDRWSVVRLDTPISATVSNLVKLARASDLRTSSLAVFHTATGELIVWGLIDQGNRYHEFVNYESDSGPERPGLFQASIVGIGHIIAYRNYERIAELRVNSIRTSALDVLSRGPVRDALDLGLDAHIASVRTAMPAEWFHDRPLWAQYIAREWIASLSRLLLRIQNYRHGGAVLITPDQAFFGLNRKYPIAYNRLRTALEGRSEAVIRKTWHSDMIWEKYIASEHDLDVPSDLYLAENIAENDVDGHTNEIKSTLWFISLLSRVDGLVLMTPRLEVRGFGVEIAVVAEPDGVYAAQDALGQSRRLKPIEYQHFGTRHRSMMRYCNAVTNSVGFVVSQDGDVRVMMKSDGRLILWDNVKLQLDNFVRPRKSRKSPSKRRAV